MNKFKELWQRIKENFKKNKVVFFVFIVIWIFLIVLTIISNNSTLNKRSEGNQYDQCVYEINKESCMYTILPIYQDATDVAIKVATYKRNNNGHINVKIIGEESGFEYADVTSNVKELQDNAFFSFPLKKKLNEKEDKNILVKLTSNSDVGEGIGVYYSIYDVFEDSKLVVDGVQIEEGDLTLRFLLPDKNFAFFSKTIIISSITIVTILILFLILLEPRLEIFFTCAIFVFGLVFLIIITPLSVPDEQTHYESSLQLTNYVLSDDYHTIIDKAYLNYSHYYGHYNISTAYTRLLEQFNLPLQLKGKTKEITNDISGQYFLYFIPQTIGIFVGRVFGLNVMKTFYLGRLTNLIFYCVCIYIALKKTPVNKLLLGIIAGLPIFVQTAASLSYDCFIEGLSFINFAVLSKWIYEDKKIKISDYILAFVISAGLAPAKYAYAFLSILFILVPYNRYGSKIKKIIFTLVLCFPALYILCPILLPRISMLFKSLLDAGSIVNTVSAQTKIEKITYSLGNEIDNLGEPYTLKYVLKHLPETIRFILFTIRYNLKPWFYGSIGSHLSGGTLILPLKFTYVLIAIILVSSLRSEQHVPNHVIRMLYMFVCVLMALMIVGGMLLYWTNIGDYYIQGVQGRYFSPFIIYFFSTFNNKKLKVSTKFDKYTIFAYLLIMFKVIIYVLSYTFVN